MRFTVVFAMLLLGLISCNEPEKPKNAEETLRAFQLAINVLDIGTGSGLMIPLRLIAENWEVYFWNLFPADASFNRKWRDRVPSSNFFTKPSH
jgi:hypothetical protein